MTKPPNSAAGSWVSEMAGVIVFAESAGSDATGWSNALKMNFGAKMNYLGEWSCAASNSKSVKIKKMNCS